MGHIKAVHKHDQDGGGQPAARRLDEMAEQATNAGRSRMMGHRKSVACIVPSGTFE